MSKNKVMLEIPVSAEALTTARHKHDGLEQAIADFINGIAKTGSGGMSYSDGKSGHSISFGRSISETRTVGVRNARTEEIGRAETSRVSDSEGWSESVAKGSTVHSSSYSHSASTHSSLSRGLRSYSTSRSKGLDSSDD